MKIRRNTHMHAHTHIYMEKYSSFHEGKKKFKAEGMRPISMSSAFLDLYLMILRKLCDCLFCEDHNHVL